MSNLLESRILNFSSNKLIYYIAMVLTFFSMQYTIGIRSNVYGDVSVNASYYNYDDLDEYDEELCLKAFDRYERFNRKMFAFNLMVAYYMMQPLAKTYDKALNQYTKDRIDDFFYNSKAPFTSVNSALQMKGKNAILALWEFIINTTLGIGGIYNVAKDFGLKSQPYNFSDTLAHYGVHSGPYIVMPLLGAMTVRDIPDVIFMLFSPSSYIIDHVHIMQMANLEFLNRTEITVGSMILKQVHNYAKIMSNTEFILKNSLDPYSMYRNYYYQQSDYLLKCKFNK